ncbi:MAG: DUF4339 domain-containing protein [Bdellovibrionaceae bacterium]|nr:DUF4339 domain-containing protein [Pseudobdellovibrionaceae bacterium]
MNTEKWIPENIPAQEKWFVLYDNGYNGPFTFEIITYLFKTHQIGKNNLLWSNDLTPWQKIENIPAFASLVSYANNPLYKSEIDSKILLDINLISNGPHAKDILFENALQAYFQETTIPAQVVPSETYPIQTAVYSKSTTPWVFVAMLTVAIALAWTGFLLTKPAFKDFSQLSPAQNMNLQALTRETLVSGQEKVVVEFKYQNEKLLFFLATNLKDGTPLHFNLAPVANTTTGLFHPQNFDLETHNATAQLQIANSDHAKLPTGYYTISVSFENRTIHQVQIFLGLLSQKEYLSELNTYHLALNQQARYEIAELKQMLLTLAQQKHLVDESLIKSLGSQDPFAHRKAAKKSLDWFELQAQIKTMIEYWDLGPQSKLYYLSLYKNIAQLEKAISDFQNIFLLALKNNNPDQALESAGLKGEGLNRDLVRLKSSLNYLENIIENPTPTH